MEIRYLQTFLTIVEVGGFTKAADKLGYAQSTITSHIQILEGELDVVLFDRLGKKIVLTSEGKSLLPYAKEMLRLYREIKSIKADENNVSGDLILGAGESLSVYRLGAILKEYKQKYPNVNIILNNSTCSDLRSKLHSGEVDIIFTIEPQIIDKDLIVNKLKDESIVFVGTRNSSLDFESVNLQQQSVLLTEKGCAFRENFENYLKHNNIKFSNTLELSSIEVIKNCAMNGIGVTLLPYYVVEKEVKEDKLKMTKIDKSYDKFNTQLAYHKNKNISIAMQKLIEITLKHALEW
ncbi:MAG: LysR family transcriptional regulator [Clostridium sp.]